MVGGGGGIAGAPPRRQEDEQKERAGHAKPEGFLLARGGLGPLRQDAGGFLGNAYLYVLRRLPHERPLVHATCQLQRCGIARVRWRTSGEEFPPRAGPKRKGLLRWGLKKGVGHPAAIAAAGRPGCSAPATLAPAAGRFPRTIPRELAGKYLFGRRPEAAPHAFGSGRQPRRPGGCGADRPPRDLPQEILEPLADAEVPRVVDRGLRAQRAALLVVLLDARAFVVDGRVFCAHHRFEGLAEAV